jgi:hypothetical protein
MKNIFLLLYLEKIHELDCTILRISNRGIDCGKYLSIYELIHLKHKSYHILIYINLKNMQAKLANFI